MANVVDLSKGITYQASLFMWGMSGAPHVFDGKMCARDNLICVVLVVLNMRS